MPTLPTILDDAIALVRHPDLTLLLDLDGTMIPFAATPEAAILDQEACTIITDLCSAGVRVLVVSGRLRDHVEPFVPLVPPSVLWMAEHGSWRSDESGEWVGPPPSAELAELAEVFQPFTTVPGVRLETKSRSLCVHWRLVPPALKDDLISRVELACDEWLEIHTEFERLDGVELVEVRKRSCNKSRAVVWARERHPATRCIAIGDDHTDEDMFAALREDELAISVGAVKTRARGRLEDPAAVRAFLRWVTETRTSSESRPFVALTARPQPNLPRASLLVVSNRTPPNTSGRNRPVGGLVSALEPAMRSHEGVWLGWSGAETDGERRLSIDRDALPVRASFDFPSGWRDHFYSGFCNRALWPLFHSFPGRVRYADDDWRAYVAANEEFARHAHRLAAPDGTVWMHDYHLLLAGRALRRHGFRGPIGMFLHIPFPSLDLFETLPWCTEVVSAMLEFDLVAFHTERWAANFRACARALAPNVPLPQVDVLPIGVEPSLFRDDGPIDPDIAGLRLALGKRRLILGVDRLDYAKGIPERLLGFERLLDTCPEWRSQVSFVQISVPSRDDVPEYAELRQRVENLVGRINGKFGEADWVPVRYLYRSYDHRILAQLYRLADVALVTPLRDGLNLVAKEFVIAQDPAKPGVLVLSRFAGAAAELGDAVLTNPFYPEGLAADIARALSMDLAERRRRHTAMSAVLADRTPERWASTFLDRLRSLGQTAAIAR